jgi:hypothetical protein
MSAPESGSGSLRTSTDFGQKAISTLLAKTF